MRANLDEATILELQYEGGYVNHPKDPGGPTKFGITLAALSQHRGHAVTAADVQALTSAEAISIYEAVYAPAIRFDDLLSGVDLLTYDAAINMGRVHASMFLQRALGVVADGSIGQLTLAALATVNDMAALIDRIKIQRAAFYQGLSTFSIFGAGWLSRLDSVTLTAEAWNKAGHAI